MDKKISQLTGATTPLTGTEEIAIVQGGSTVKATAQDVADLAAGLAYKELSIRFAYFGSVAILGGPFGDYLSATITYQATGSYLLDLATADNTTNNIVLTSTTQSGGSVIITSCSRISGGGNNGKFQINKKNATTGADTDSDISTIVVRIYP